MGDFIKWIGENKDTVTGITAILAIVASTISILLAIMNMRWQRVHYRKTLMPIHPFNQGELS